MKPRDIHAALIGCASACAAGAALAAEDCPAAPRHRWKPAAEVLTATEALGYRPTGLASSGGCYEVRAVDKRGRHYRVKFDPTDLRMVSRYVVKDGQRELASR